MHASVLEWVGRNLHSHEVEGKHVLEVGSYNVNGSVRPYIERMGPASYLGVDLNEGPGVDLVRDISKGALWRSGRDNSNIGTFSVVVSTEMLEHAEHWYTALACMVGSLGSNGLLLLTARGPGFPFHNPPDHWRFTCDDMLRAMHNLGMSPLQVCEDPQVPGVFLKACKATNVGFRVQEAPKG